MKFISIEWLRNKMKNLTVFECHCGNKYNNFDDWWNHVIIKKHILADGVDFEKFIEGLK